ncbi:alpha/beta-hydrolase [Ramaria rubella]|nr:alpha/beta-hydrolase [Ramaria rubella]
MMSLLPARLRKLLYLAYFAIKLVTIKIPFWTLISLPRFMRPRPSWSIRKCLFVYTIREVMQLPVSTGLKYSRDPNEEVPDSTLKDARFTWIEGIDDEYILGELREYAKIAGLSAAKIPGYWQFRPGTTIKGTLHAQEGERVVYHFHGGGMYLSSAHPSDQTAHIPRGIMKHSNTVSRTFAVDYRLCSSAPSPVANGFPAALLDCLSGYQYLINLGFKPENIIVAGDSAGGNLALALVRYLTRHSPPGLAPPGKLLLLSLWGYCSLIPPGPTSSLIVNLNCDMFPQTPPKKPGDKESYGVISYLGKMNPKELHTNPYFSPSSPHLDQTDGMFKDFPKTYIMPGGAEVLLDDSRIVAERMKADNNSKKWITLDVIEDAIHDSLVFPVWEPERSQALTRIGGWIDWA